RVGVPDRAREERARGPRARRDHHLQPGNVRVKLFLGLRVVLERADAAAVGHADHHLAVEAALGAHPIARPGPLPLPDGDPHALRRITIWQWKRPWERIR